jgi:hypothetical protein
MSEISATSAPSPLDQLILLLSRNLTSEVYGHSLDLLALITAPQTSAAAPDRDAVRKSASEPRR